MKVELKIYGVEYNCTPKVEKEEIKESEFKVALVDGHYEGDKGAYSKLIGHSEWGLFDEYFISLRNGTIQMPIDIFYHNKNLTSYTDRQKEMAHRTKDYDLVIENHFNKFNGEASGSMALFNEHNGVTELLADKFSELMVKKGFKKRSNKPVSFNDDKTENGEGFLRETKQDAILLEWFFGDNKEDCERITFDLMTTVLNDLINYYRTIKGK